MIAAAHWTGEVESVAFTLFGKDIAWYGIIITSAMLIGLLLGIKRVKVLKITSDDMLELFLFAIPFAVIFARLGFVVFRPEEFFLIENFSFKDFVNIFAVWDGGLTIMTGVPGGILGGFIWSRIRKVDFIDVVDRLIPVVLVSQAIGRWGNFFNQEIYGLPITNPDLQFFPIAVFIKDRGGFFQATFFYEMLLNLLFFVIIVMIMKRLKVKGGGLLLYAISYPLIRFIMEFMRDDLGFYVTINYAQLASALICVVAGAILTLLIILEKKKGNRVWYKNGVPKELYLPAKKKDRIKNA